MHPLTLEMILVSYYFHHLLELKIKKIINFVNTNRMKAFCSHESNICCTCMDAI